MSLVEVAVALVLAGVGVSAVVRAGTHALALSARSHAVLSATLEVVAVADSLAAAPALVVDGFRTRDGIRVEWNVERMAAADVAHVRIRAYLPGSRDSLVFPLLIGPPVPGID